MGYLDEPFKSIPEIVFYIRGFLHEDDEFFSLLYNAVLSLVEWEGKLGDDVYFEARLKEAFWLLLEKGDIEVGEFDSNDVFKSWQLSKDEAFQRMVSRARQLTEDPLPGDVCYFRLIEKIIRVQ